MQTRGLFKTYSKKCRDCDSADSARIFDRGLSETYLLQQSQHYEDLLGNDVHEVNSERGSIDIR